MAIFIKGGGGGSGVALDGGYADPDQLGAGKSETAPGQAKQRLAADQTWSDPLEHFAESWDETYKVSALTGREDPDDAEATVDIALVPKGQGGLQAAIPDGTTTGGNARGQYAVDLQCSPRGAATQVAAALYTVIAGGVQNTASSTSSSVLGGQGNTAQATNATVGGGQGNTASGSGSVVPGGYFATASGNYSIASGNQNVSSGLNSVAIGGERNTASASHSCVLGGYYASATLQGQMALAYGRFSANGDAQQSWLTMRNSTTDATQTELFLNGSSQRITVPSGSRFRFRVDIICTNETDGTGNAYEIKGAIKNIAGTTALIGTNVSNVWEDDAAFAAVVEADDTNDALVVKVTGAAGKTCRWVASVHLVQVT